MKQMMTVFGFTFRDAVRKRSFKISLVVITIVILVLFFVLSLIGTEDETEEVATETDSIVYYIDESNLLPTAMESLAAVMPDIEFKSGTASERSSYIEQIREESNMALIEITADAQGKPSATYTTKDFMTGLSTDGFTAVLNKVYVATALGSLGASEDMISTALYELPSVNQSAGDMNFGGYLIGILLIMILFFAVYYYGYGVAMSVATEKTSRVMETLVVSAKPSNVLFGKCLAMGVVGLAEVLYIIVLSSISYMLLIPENFTLLGMPLSLSAFTPVSALLVILYFLLAYSLYAMMNAVCGALVSKIEDLNSAMMPVMFVAIISFYLGYIAALTDLGGVISKVAMYLPFSSAFCVPFKLLNGGVATIDLIISLVVLAVSVVFVTLVCVRIYSASVLHYGKRLKMTELYKQKV